MKIRVVESKHNARLKELKRALGQPGRKGAELVGVEGPHLVAEAVRAGLRVECVFAVQGEERLLEQLDLPEETEVLLAPRALLDAALATETPQAVAALVRPRAWSWDAVTGREGTALIVVLAGLQDPGNVGTILRSAEAFGATGVVSLPGTVSEWNAKAVRASAGSVFRVPVLDATAEECFARLGEAHVATWTTAVRDAKDATAVDWRGAAAMIVGNEGAGVPTEIAAKADGAVTIPCPGEVESLNAAVAASVLLYVASSQRGAKR